MSELLRWPSLAATFTPRTGGPAAPAAGSLDAPLVCLRVNASWFSHALGALEALAASDAWAGNETERERAVQEVERLLASAGACEMSVPAGVIWPYAGSSAPDGWLLCQGQAVSRADYAALFAAIGTTYGAGDGATTFNVPDLRRRSPIGAGGNWALGAPVGAETHTLLIDELPGHDHVQRGNMLGTLYHGASGGSAARLTLSQTTISAFSGSFLTTAATGGGQAHNNVGPSLALNFIICAGG